MFLKKIEMQGFKSFADKVTISFDHQVTGIVGPNGCGKSNITDAVRWVLGEQSAKSLRGTSMSDVIFAGSANRKTVNTAEVTLVFDNTQRFLNAEYDEIEITRRIHRGGEGEYYLNRVPVRLKDIQDLILDSGLGRDSLSMISQGNISSFAEAKPIERRALFEEAAGVAKYKKRKIESLNKLERTQDNIERMNDIISELERQVSPLKRAAKKAEIYREKKERLQAIEIAVLVDEIEFFNHQMEESKKTYFDIETKTTMNETTIQVQETANSEFKKEQLQLDIEINQYQEDLLKVVSEIQTLETRKIEVDEKRKYALEVGNDQEKAKELKSLLEESSFEYEDRLTRLNQIEVDIKLLNTQVQEITLQQIEHNQQLEEGLSTLRRLQNRKDVLENLLRQPFNQQAGVRAVMEAQSSLPGVLGVMAQIMKPQKDYEEAISVALGGSMYHIVTKDEASARQAINFLKKNNSGRATFLPRNILRERYINREHEIICENTVGFLGTASQFVENEEEFDVVRESLLGNVLVVEDLEKGNHLADLLKYQYKIVTLDGDVIHRGGSMTGGRQKDSSSPLTIQKELDHIELSLVDKQQTVQTLTDLSNEDKRVRTELNDQLMEKRINSAQLEPIVEAKRAKYERLKSDYELISPNQQGDGEEVNSFADDLIIRLNECYSKRDEITSNIRTKRERRMKITSEGERREQQLRQMRRDLNQFQNDLNQIKIDQARIETKLENDLARLASEYQLTYEFAKEQVKETDVENAKEEVVLLRQQIEALGNVNMSAPEEFSEVNERYEFLTHQCEDLISSKNQLLSAIDEMDEVMSVQFKEMFDKINAELQDTFHQLFGGGKAKLVLEDPNDILNTGIDIDVQPPGKSVQNIRLFSGGEKALIAISVLFSILKARPVPLCIFDEVEAALDQGNVERFARYLKQFGNTQFVVVTHRPGTMAQCDVLYGVTMQSKGVSQMLKVKLAEATEMADEEEVQQ